MVLTSGTSGSPGEAVKKVSVDFVGELRLHFEALLLLLLLKYEDVGESGRGTRSASVVNLATSG